MAIGILLDNSWVFDRPIVAKPHPRQNKQLGLAIMRIVAARGQHAKAMTRVEHGALIISIEVEEEQETRRLNKVESESLQSVEGSKADRNNARMLTI